MLPEPQSGDGGSASPPNVSDTKSSKMFENSCDEAGPAPEDTVPGPRTDEAGSSSPESESRAAGPSERSAESASESSSESAEDEAGAAAHALAPQAARGAAAPR